MYRREASLAIFRGWKNVIRPHRVRESHVQDLGETGPEQQCVWCSSVVFHHLILVRSWLTYFFIALIPYRSEYKVECPGCHSGIVIIGKEVKAAKKGKLKLRR